MEGGLAKLTVAGLLLKLDFYKEAHRCLALIRGSLAEPKQNKLALVKEMCKALT